MRRLLLIGLVSVFSSTAYAIDPPKYPTKVKTEAELRAEKAAQSKLKKESIKDARSQRLQQESLKKQQEIVLRQQMFMQQLAADQIAWERYWAKANAEATRYTVEDSLKNAQLERAVSEGVRRGIIEAR